MLAAGGEKEIKLSLLKKKSHFPQVIYNFYPYTLRNVGLKKNLNTTQYRNACACPDSTRGHVLQSVYSPAQAVHTATPRGARDSDHHFPGEETDTERGRDLLNVPQ